MRFAISQICRGFVERVEMNVGFFSLPTLVILGAFPILSCVSPLKHRPSSTQSVPASPRQLQHAGRSVRLGRLRRLVEPRWSLACLRNHLRC